MRAFTRFELSEIKRISTELRQRAIEITRLESELGAILGRHGIVNKKAVSDRLWDELGTIKEATARLEVSF